MSANTKNPWDHLPDHDPKRAPAWSEWLLRGVTLAGLFVGMWILFAVME